MTTMDALDISLDSDLRLVRELAPALCAICRQLGFNSDETAEIELAVCEAVNNAIIHAYHRQPGNPVRLTVKPVAGQLLIQVIDQGAPLTSGLQERLPSKSATDLEEDGRGLTIIRAVMNELRYHPTPAGNIVEMRRPLPQR